MKNLKAYPAIVLSSICLVVAICLSGINMITAPIIIARADALAAGAKAEVLPGASGFTDITADHEFPASVPEAHSADIGFVFRSVGKGRNGEIVLMVGVSLDGKITGTKVISEGESKGYKEKVYNIAVGTEGGYTGMSLDTFSPVIASGATMTSNGFADAVKSALQAYVIALGGSVDLRTPEQILQDNCNLALGTEGKTFEKWFAVEVIEGIDAVYESDSGRVYLIGESFVGINADGTVVTADASEENKALASAADAVISASKITEIAKPEGVSSAVKNVYVTESGNYVFDLEGYGYKYESNWEFVGVKEGEMNIKLSISADGKIIDVITVSHEETNGYGSACASEEYYAQYRGAENEDIVVTVKTPDFHADQIPADNTDVGVIASSTFTTTGYQNAVKAAFGAFEILTASEGGNGQ